MPLPLLMPLLSIRLLAFKLFNLKSQTDLDSLELAHLIKSRDHPQFRPHVNSNPEKAMTRIFQLGPPNLDYKKEALTLEG